MMENIKVLEDSLYDINFEHPSIDDAILSSFLSEAFMACQKLEDGIEGIGLDSVNELLPAVLEYIENSGVNADEGVEGVEGFEGIEGIEGIEGSSGSGESSGREGFGDIVCNNFHLGVKETISKLIDLLPKILTDTQDTV